jgi:hypothetical protein
LGTIDINNLNISKTYNSDFELQIKPESYDIVSAFNNIIRIDQALLHVTAIADDTINGDSQAGTNYQFNSIRTLSTDS